MKKKSIITLLLTFLLVLSIIPANANAKETTRHTTEWQQEYKNFLNSRLHKPIKLKLTHNYIGVGSRKFNYEWNGVKGATKYKVQRSSNKNFDGCGTEYVIGTNYGYWLGGGLGFYDRVAHLDWHIRVKPIFGKCEGRWSKPLFVPGDLNK